MSLTKLTEKDKKRKRKKRSQRKTMFGKPKSKELADIVRIDSPAAAELSVKELEEEFKRASRREKKVHIIRAATLAANRSEAMRNRVGAKERAELGSVASIYRQSAHRMSKSLEKRPRKK